MDLRGDSLLIDISRLLGRVLHQRLPTGVDRVCIAYIERFGASSQAVVQWNSWRRILPRGESQELFTLLRNPRPGAFRDALAVIGRACIPPWPSQDAQGRIYLNTGHAGLQEPGLPEWLQRTRQRPVYMVHDLIPVTHPEYCRPGEGKRHAERMEMLLRSGAGVLTNSKLTLQQLHAFARERNLAVPPGVAAPLAPASLQFDHTLPAPVRQPYFVVVGTIEPRKNHWLLLHVWRQLAAEMGESAPHLVIVGQRGWECENVVDLLERCPGLRGLVHEMPACQDEQLGQFLGHARALLFPSFAEGYGMPLVEALALGTPAIATRLPAFEEVAGDIPDYLDPLDGPGWAQAVRDYLAPSSARRDAQLRRLERFDVPTWEKHFAQVETLLEQLR
jgi:glycosyltransferase involved in cell wall biosynthesis